MMKWLQTLLISLALLSGLLLGQISFAQSASHANYSLIQEPQAGRMPFIKAINGAKTSIIVAMFILSDRGMIAALRHAAERGVDVAVMVDPAPYHAKGVNQRAKAILKKAGVDVFTGNPQFAFTHQKSMVIDGRTSFILTFNWTYKAFLKHTRRYHHGLDFAEKNFAIRTDNHAIAREITAVFWSDVHRHRPYMLSSKQTPLVWSPRNSAVRIARLLSFAKQQILLYQLEISDKSVIRILQKKARQGVRVRVIMAQDVAKKYAADIRKRFVAKGIQVGYFAHKMNHAKIVIVDPSLPTGRFYLGSMNMSTTSMKHNRELGIILPGKQQGLIMRALYQSFRSDWVNATKL